MRAWKEHAVRRAADLAAELVEAHVERPAADVITYTPPDPFRQLRRGEHPATALARNLAERWQLPVERLLVRTRPSSRQAGLAHGARGRNTRGLFAAAANGTIEGTVVLVDDVYTTGSTASAAAAALRRSGATRIDVVTFARTPR